MIFGFLDQNPYNYFCYMVLQKPYNNFWLYGYIVLNPYSFKNHITVWEPNKRYGCDTWNRFWEKDLIWSQKSHFFKGGSFWKSGLLSGLRAVQSSPEAPRRFGYHGTLTNWHSRCICKIEIDFTTFKTIFQNVQFSELSIAISGTNMDFISSRSRCLDSISWLHEY